MTESNSIEQKTPSLQSEETMRLSVPFGVLSATLSNDESTLFTAGMDGQITQIDLDSQTQTSIGKHESYASGIVQLSDSNRLISSGYDGLLIWHDIQGKHPLHVVKAHEFWSWALTLSSNKQRVASVSGQYQSGGYRYEPAAETEPSIRVYDTETAELTHEFSHTPPVTSVAFSPDNRFLAAGNLMGQIKIFDLTTGKLSADLTSPDFTSWGIIKSHHYIGGIFDLMFTPGSDEIIACGMGPMRDPMAGNGKQTWQKFRWQSQTEKPIQAISDSDTGKGLMETLALDTDQDRFVMAGRLAQGQWNTAIFDLSSGTLLHSLDTKMRTTKALFAKQGRRLILSGARSQKPPKEGKWPDFGQILIFEVS